MIEENEVKLKRAYWQGVFDALSPAEKARSDKAERDRLTAGVWLAALDWILGQNGDSVSTLEVRNGSKD